MTDAERLEFDRLSIICGKLINDHIQDVDLVFELLRGEHLLDSRTVHSLTLRRHAEHYRTLSQERAKVNLWGKMSHHIYGFQSELSFARQSKERGGSIDQ